jgi:hypothetical protein
MLGSRFTGITSGDWPANNGLLNKNLENNVKPDIVLLNETATRA